MTYKPDMDFEIEFRAVGDTSRAGDAIVIRYVEDGAYKVIVVDGGTDDSGEALCDHIHDVYGANTFIDHVISTHPDTDHACGLRNVLKRFNVGTLWLHGVWHHAAQMLPYFENKRWTEAGLEQAIRKEYSVIEELIDLADAQETLVYEPFRGTRIGPFTVLSPTLHSYIRLVPQFRKTPAHDAAALKAENWLLGTRKTTGLLAEIAEVLRTWIDERWDVETLREGALTAAENESSTVLYGDFGEKQLLLTADAGVNALRWACEAADNMGIDLLNIDLIQVPHHGSRSNVSPSILNRLVGPILPHGTASAKLAVVSAPKDDTKHPRKIVMNAFRRRGAAVYPTQGNYVRWHHGNMPARNYESPSQPLEFFDRVESYD